MSKRLMKNVETSSIHELLKKRLHQERKIDWYHENKTIHSAAKFGFLNDVADFLRIRRSSLNSYDQYSKTPLYYACLCGHSHVVEYLLSMGAKDRDEIAYMCALKEVDRELIKMAQKYRDYNNIPISVLERIHVRQKRTMVKSSTYKSGKDDHYDYSESDSVFGGSQKKRKKKKKDFCDLKFGQVINKVFNEHVRTKRVKLYIESEGEKKKKKKEEETNVYPEEKPGISELKSPCIVLINHEHDMNFEDMVKMQIPSSAPAGDEKVVEMEGEDQQQQQHKASKRAVRFKSDVAIEYMFSDVGKQTFHCHLFILLLKWTYFRNKYLSFESLAKKLDVERTENGNFDKTFNQVLFEELEKMKGKTFFLKDDRSPCTTFEALLKSFYTGNVKIFNRIMGLNTTFELIVLKHRVEEADLATRLYTTESAVTKILSREKKLKVGEDEEVTVRGDPETEQEYLELLRFHLSDCRIRTFDDEGEEKEVFLLNKFILCHRTPFFNLAFNGPFKDSENMDFAEESHESVKQLIRFMYTEQCKFPSNEVVIELTVFAQKFFFRQLYKRCVSKLLDIVNKDNMVELFFFGDRFQIVEIYTVCMEAILNIIRKNEYLWKDYLPEFEKLGLDTRKIRRKAIDYGINLREIEEKKLSKTDLSKAIEQKNVSKVEYLIFKAKVEVDHREIAKLGKTCSSKEFYKYIFSLPNFNPLPPDSESDETTTPYFIHVVQLGNYDIALFLLNEFSRKELGIESDEVLLDLIISRLDDQLLNTCMATPKVKFSANSCFDKMLEMMKGFSKNVCEKYATTLLSLQGVDKFATIISTLGRRLIDYERLHDRDVFKNKYDVFVATVVDQFEKSVKVQNEKMRSNHFKRNRMQKFFGSTVVNILNRFPKKYKSALYRRERKKVKWGRFVEFAVYCKNPDFRSNFIDVETQKILLGF